MAAVTLEWYSCMILIVGFSPGSLWQPDGPRPTWNACVGPSTMLHPRRRPLSGLGRTCGGATCKATIARLLANGLVASGCTDIRTSTTGVIADVKIGPNRDSRHAQCATNAHAMAAGANTRFAVRDAGLTVGGGGGGGGRGEHGGCSGVNVVGVGRGSVGARGLG